MAEKPIALDAYERLAPSYAAAVDTKPHNAYYERPATLSLLPPVGGMRVLDAGCGPGVYSAWLLEHGAEVVAVDVSPKMVELARIRTRGRAEFHVADLASPVGFLDSNSFGLVVAPLVLEYIEDWRPTLREFFRLLAPGGCLVLSVSHPFSDFTYFGSDRYFETELVASQWKGFHPLRVLMPSYRRSLEETLNPLLESGFWLDRVLEPRPTADFRTADPRHFEELSRQPCFLCVRALKPRERDDGPSTPGP
jgi:SAM-dependent methyltransferase